MRRRCGLAFGTVALLGLVLALAMGANQDEPNPDTSKIAREQVGYVRKALDSLDRQVANGQRPPADPDIRKWARRLVEAERQAGNMEAYRKASEDYLELMEKNARMAESKYGIGELRTPQYMDAMYELNEARLWLARKGAGK
jgi:hypothetical protein